MRHDELISALYDEWVPVNLHKMEGLKTVWLASDYAGSRSSFLEKFSYANSETPCFSTARFNKSDNITMLAERYGGKGIGYNGGGARCGTLGKYQLKGIGTNPLVGDHDNKVHAYGGLDAKSAINEIIFTKVLEKVLPIGAAQVYGMIFTGTTTAIDPVSEEQCWGAILVREACVRPAHFLPSSGFAPRLEQSKSLRPDFARTKIVNQNLAGRFSSSNEYIMFMGGFLKKCANQMAFSRIARIMHSTLTPSNISIDGRWLDVPLSSFVSGGENFGLSSCFYQEASEPLTFCIELIHTYGKMNNLLLNPAPLVSYYNELFDSYLTHHLGYLFGLPFEGLGDEFKSDLNSLKGFSMGLISKGRDVNHAWPQPNVEDPITNLIMGAFISIDDPARGQSLLEKAGIKESCSRQLIIVFARLVHALAAMQKKNVHAFALTHGITALKRSVLAGIFYLSLVDREVGELCQNGSPNEIEVLIDSYNTVATWIFEKDEDELVTIFSSDKIALVYNKHFSEFQITDKARNDVTGFKNITNSLGVFREIIDVEEEVFRGFSYKNYFERVFSLSNHLCAQGRNLGAIYAA